MAPKKQLTFAESIARAKKAKSPTQPMAQPTNDSLAPKAPLNTNPIMETIISSKVLEDSHLMASSSSLETYRKLSPLSDASHGQVNANEVAIGRTRTSERIKRVKNDKDAKGVVVKSNSLSLLNDEEDGEDEEGEGNDQRGGERAKALKKRDQLLLASWRDAGLDLLSVLSWHLSPVTCLQIQHQELLIHMVLNADFELRLVNEAGGKINSSLMATRALSLLMDNATLHPPCQQSVDQCNVLLLNEITWTPDRAFQYEKGCYAAALESGSFTQIPKLMFFNSVLSSCARYSDAQVGRQEVQKKRNKGGKDEEREDQIGVIGSSMLLTLIARLLTLDYDTREKVYKDSTKGLGGPNRDRSLVADGNANPVSILTRSSLARLITYKANAMDRSWSVWSSLAKEAIHYLIALILNGAPRDIARQPTKGTKAGAKGNVEREEGPDRALVSTSGELASHASALLSRIMDLFMVMEEERQYESLIEDKDTEFRFATNFILDKFLSKTEPKGSEYYFSSKKLQDPRIKATLLSSLSARVRLHLLGMCYAKDSSKRWDVGAKDGSGSNSIVVLPLNRYLDGSMSVRVVHEVGPVRINHPAAVLSDLDVEQHFNEGVKRLLSHTNDVVGGDGFVLWICSFYRAAVTLVKDDDPEKLKELEGSFDKVWTRYVAHRDLKLKGRAEDAALASFNKMQLYLARKVCAPCWPWG